VRRELLALLAAALLAPTPAAAVATLPAGPPDATVNLATREGVALVRGAWRYHDVDIVDVEHRSPGPDRKPSGPPNRTHDIVPQAGARDFDDSTWEVLDPTTLEERRSTGKLCFAWYRIAITVPEAVGSVDPTGATLVFETVVDDYAEVWVNGELPRALGQAGGSLVAGWNAPNRVVLGRDVKPGQVFHVAVFAMNGPVSDTPDNYIWMRSATLDVFREPHAVPPTPVTVRVDRRSAELDRLLPAHPVAERLATGFRFTEGPLWLPEGALLFSDPNTNIIWRWTPAGDLSVFRHPSGYDGADVAEYRQPGSNGLALDAAGRLTACEHGNRRVTRTERDGTITVLADRYDGKRLNSPNDLVYRSDGSLYFTDPPFGLPGFHDDPRREQPHFGVYRVKDGVVRLLATDFTGPNGLAFSPDERFLYVANWDEAKKSVYRYPVRADGTLGAGESFFDLTRAPGDEALDGLKVDELGNLYVSGPGGLWIVAPDGKVLGTIVLPELPANFTFGDADGRTLYLTARSGVYRMRMNVAGAAPGMAAAR
jgi:gluconolactonase